MIHLGFEIGTGRAVEIPLRHLAATGQTQESGKTTTLEALIHRSGLRAIAFVTKRGESSFHVSNPIPPYFRERTDWPFVAAILEATLSERLKFQRSWIMKLCASHSGRDGKWAAPRSLGDVHRNVEIAIEKARGLNESVYTELREYLKMILPQIERLPYSPRLELQAGVNVMDLAPYDFPLQALVVRSVIEWIHKHERNTISVIPEAWKFAPKQRGSPVRLAAEELIREGGALKNFIWLDSQDIAGVADVLLRQVGVWIFGVQRAKHEIERTLAHIPAELQPRPRGSDIAMLAKGQFIVCWERQMYKLYVQPAWMTAAHAEAIARGEEEVDSAREILRDFDVEHERPAGRSKIVIPSASEESAPAHRKADSSPKEQVRNDNVYVPLPAEFPPMESFSVIPEEEEMWKEKYDAAQREIKELKAKIENLDSVLEGMQKAHGASMPVIKPQRMVEIAQDLSALDGFYEAFKRKLLAEPAVLHVLAQKPEIRVTLERPTIDCDGGSLRGRIARLIADDFFKEPQNGNTAFNEIQRRGGRVAKPNVYRELDKLAELGFVTKEAAGYKAVEGMKVKILES